MWFYSKNISTINVIQRQKINMSIKVLNIYGNVKKFKICKHMLVPRNNSNSKNSKKSIQIVRFKHDKYLTQIQNIYIYLI